MTPFSREGFTVVELLVMLVLLLVMSTLMLRPIGIGNDPAEVRQAAFRLLREVERAQARAQADRSPWYWVVPGPLAQWTDDAKSAAYQAYQFVPELDPLPEEVDWISLPEGMVFSPDAGNEARDLIEEAAMLEYSRSGSFEQIEGEFRVLAAFLPDGSIRVGADGEMISSSVRIARGSWVTDAALNSFFIEDEKGGQPVRLRLRTRTGVLVVEEIVRTRTVEEAE